MKLSFLTNMLALPPTLLLLVVSQLAAAQGPGEQLPTAIRKMPPDGGAKFFPEYAAFSPAFSYEEARLYPRGAAAEIRGYSPGFNLHEEHEDRDAFRRAAEALGMLQKREACPPTMSGCGNVGHPNKCCFEKEECVEVEDPSVGNVACCPQGLDCRGGVGSCPPTAVTCPADLGGGCCIAGYLCRGSGCEFKSPFWDQPSRPRTTLLLLGMLTPLLAGVRDTSSDKEPPGATTLTTTSTNWADGSPSTVIVTIVTTVTNPPSITTRTTVITESVSTTSTVPSSTTSGPAAPFRPTSDDNGGGPTPTGSFCPKGFYGCLARDGGGCCQTGRDCQTTSCPPTPMTTIIAGGVTIAVPVADLPSGGDREEATQTCAGGWFLCDGDDDEGDEAGCCPSGYRCGKESCTVTSPSETAEVQKERPGDSAGGRVRGGLARVLGCLSVVGVLHLL